MGVQGGGMGSRDVALGAWGFRIWCSALGFSLRDVPGLGFEGSTLFVSAVNQTGLHSPPAPGCLVQFDFRVLGLGDCQCKH